MSIRTKESLNCPCNGIYKCGLHSVPPNISKIVPTVKDHGKISGVSCISLDSPCHCHKITVSKGKTILCLKTINGNMQSEYELEIEVE